MYIQPTHRDDYQDRTLCHVRGPLAPFEQVGADEEGERLQRADQAEDAHVRNREGLPGFRGRLFSRGRHRICSPPRAIHGLRSGSFDAILLTNPNLQLGCMHTIHARRFVILYAFVLYMYLSGRGDRACSVLFPPLLNITPCGASCWSSHERSPVTGSGLDSCLSQLLLS